jgi:hypothetical protein
MRLIGTRSTSSAGGQTTGGTIKSRWTCSAIFRTTTRVPIIKNNNNNNNNYNKKNNNNREK